MKSISYIRMIAILVSVLALSSCRQDTQGDLDFLLDQALADASGGQGKSYFRLPTDGNLNGIPQDPNNRLTQQKVELGKMLFHETALGTNPRDANGAGTYSCASCHHAAGGFQANLIQGIGEGGLGFGAAGEGRQANPAYQADSVDRQPIRTPSALNVAYQKVTLWNGQFGATGPNNGTQAFWTSGTPIETNTLGYEGAEIQAIAGLKVHRLSVDNLLANAPGYELLFDQAFPFVPASDRVTRENAGLAIAAYERTLLPSQAPFQKWLRGDVYAMNDQEKMGAILFFDKARCYTCHNGPALNSDEFHCIGLDDLDGPGVYGVDGEDVAHLGRGGFTGSDVDMFHFKVPQLYNLQDSPFYGHGGSFTSLEDVVRYKNLAVPQNPSATPGYLADEFVPLNLSEEEIQDLTAFLSTALRDPDLDRFVPYSTPSGQCFPNADVISSADLGCN